MMIDDISFGYLLTIGLITIFFAGCIWRMSRDPDRERDRWRTE